MRVPARVGSRYAAGHGRNAGAAGPPDGAAEPIGGDRRRPDGHLLRVTGLQRQPGRHPREPTVGFTSLALPRADRRLVGALRPARSPRRRRARIASRSTRPASADLYINGRLVASDNYGRDRSPVAHALVDAQRRARRSTIRVDYVAQRLPRRIAVAAGRMAGADPALLQAAVAAAGPPTPPSCSSTTYGPRAATTPAWPCPATRTRSSRPSRPPTRGRSSSSTPAARC